MRGQVEQARKVGVSLRRFLGWEPVTTYEHDDEGRLTASQPEPEWDDEQRGWLLALAEVERDVCPGCRNPLSESTAQDEWGRAAHHYEAPPPTRCHACTALAAAQSDTSHQHRQALLWVTRKSD